VETLPVTPGVRCDDERWDPAKKVDWASVRAVWLHRVAELRARGRVDVVIEKSPPNMVRLEGLLEAFRDIRSSR
jgi:hypothetical protein